MPWHTSDRVTRLPNDWRKRRAAVRRRAGGRCEALDGNGSRCTARGTECDHVRRGDNHNLDNLQWLCATCHARKTRAETTEARATLNRRRPPEPHPGMRA